MHGSQKIINIYLAYSKEPTYICINKQQQNLEDMKSKGELYNNLIDAIQELADEGLNCNAFEQAMNECNSKLFNLN